MTPRHDSAEDDAVPESGEIGIPVSDRRTAPDSLTVNPWPVLIARNDPLDGLLPNREFKETS